MIPFRELWTQCYAVNIFVGFFILLGGHMKFVGFLIFHDREARWRSLTPSVVKSRRHKAWEVQGGMDAYKKLWRPKRGSREHWGTWRQVEEVLETFWRVRCLSVSLRGFASGLLRQPSFLTSCLPNSKESSANNMTLKSITSTITSTILLTTCSSNMNFIGKRTINSRCLNQRSDRRNLERIHLCSDILDRLCTRCHKSKKEKMGGIHCHLRC